MFNRTPYMKECFRLYARLRDEQTDSSAGAIAVIASLHT